MGEESGCFAARLSCTGTECLQSLLEWCQGVIQAVVEYLVEFRSEAMWACTTQQVKAKIQIARVLGVETEKSHGGAGCTFCIGIGTGQLQLHGGLQAFQRFGQQGTVDLFLGRKIRVDGPRGIAGTTGDLAHACAVQAMRIKDVAGGVQDQCALGITDCFQAFTALLLFQFGIVHGQMVA